MSSVDRYPFISGKGNQSGAAGQVKKAGYLGRNITVITKNGNNSVNTPLNRGSLIDFLNSQGANLKKGWYFFGGSSDQQILEFYNKNNINSIRPEVFEAYNEMKTKNTNTIDTFKLPEELTEAEAKHLLKGYLKIKYPDGQFTLEDQNGRSEPQGFQSICTKFKPLEDFEVATLITTSLPQCNVNVDFPTLINNNASPVVHVINWSYKKT